MGLDWQGTKFLAEARGAGLDMTRTLTIGRQDRHVSMPKVRQLLESFGLSHTLTESDMQVETGPADPVFMQLGAQVVDSVDASDYEGATIVADMNRPVPTELHETYDLVFDGGTLEHVFNVRQAFCNAMSLPRVGGSLIIHTMANNWFGHGFYQFSPEFFYRVLSPENGYQVVRAVAHECFERAQWYEIPDPAEVRLADRAGQLLARHHAADPCETRGIGAAVHQDAAAKRLFEYVEGVGSGRPSGDRERAAARGGSGRGGQRRHQQSPALDRLAADELALAPAPETQALGQLPRGAQVAQRAAGAQGQAPVFGQGPARQVPPGEITSTQETNNQSALIRARKERERRIRRRGQRGG